VNTLILKKQLADRADQLLELKEQLEEANKKLKYRTMQRDAARKSWEEIRQAAGVEPRNKTMLPPEFQKFWEDCIELSGKARFKSMMHVWDDLEARFAASEAERKRLRDLAPKFAELANECCYRSDGWRESLEDRFRRMLETGDE